MGASDLRTTNNSLGRLFTKVFCKFGFDSQEESDRVVFESHALRGEVTLKKPFTVNWKTKRGYSVYDLPLANGNSSVQFKKVGDCLDFLRRHILHK